MVTDFIKKLFVERKMLTDYIFKAVHNGQSRHTFKSLLKY